MTRVILALMATLFLALPATAQGILRDAESERALRELARPLFGAAGLNGGSVNIWLIEDRHMNAFVADPQHIFVTTGLLLRLDRAEELQAVLAHEIAHITNGHLARRSINAASARTAAGLGLVLAAAAAVSGNGRVAAPVAIGTQNTAMRIFLAHTRAEEASADQSGIRYMAAAGIDPSGAKDVLELFRGQEALNVSNQDPYAISHPLSRERIRAVEGFAAAYAGRTAPNQNSDYWFAVLKGKLAAYIENPSRTIRNVRNDNSAIGLMRQAVAYHRMPRPAEAIRAATALVNARPNDPYARETLGWILLENRRPGEAIGAYRAAVRLAPNEPLILAGLGRALVVEGSAGALREALNVLERSRSRDTGNPNVLRDLATAYAKTGNPGMASISSAERFALIGRLADAAVHAGRAADLLPRGSPGWNRAQDILRAADAAGVRRR